MINQKLIIRRPLLVFILLLVILVAPIIYKPITNFLKNVTEEFVISQDRFLQYRPQVTINEYPNHPGFPIYYDEWTEKSSVTIADINNDGNNELLLPTYEGNIHAWSAAGGLLPGFPINTDGKIRGQLALADINHDGKLEISAGIESPSMGVGPSIGIWKPDGTLMAGWLQHTSCARNDQYCGVASVSFFDLDNDSNMEVIAATNNRDLTTSDPSRYVPNLYVWKSNGQLAPGDWPNEDDHNVAIIGQIAVGDLDGDSYSDIVTGRDYNRLFAFNRLGSFLNGWPHYVWYPYDANDWNDDQIEFPRSSPALADLDEDGELEYIIPGHRRHQYSTEYLNSELLVYNSSGVRWNGWELPASSSTLISDQTTRMIEAPSIADLTGDGKPEIILATQDGWIRAYTADKQVLWEYNYAQGKQIHTSEAVIGDVDGDGLNDVVFGTYAIYLDEVGPVGLYILDQNGNPKPGTPIWVTSPGISHSPALGDLDSDGLIEIAAATYDGWVHVWDTPGPDLPGRLPWPMPRHDLQRTGLYIDPEPDFSNSTLAVSNMTPDRGNTITFRFELIQSGTPVNETIQFTNSLPSGLSYVHGSLTATSGSVDDSQPSVLLWNGTMYDTSQVTITFSAIVSLTAPGAITNVAEVDAGSAGQFSRSVAIYINGKSVFLPLTRR